MVWDKTKKATTSYGACFPQPVNNNKMEKTTGDNRKPEKTATNFEDLLELTGGFGKFQYLILIVLLFFEIPAAFVAFAPVFVGRQPNSWICTNEDGNVTSIEQASSELCNCNGTLLPQPNTESSIVTEWNLVCEKAWVSDFMTSLQMFGMLLGSLFTSQLSDWYGRKKSYLCVCLMMGLGQCLSGVAPTPTFYAIARFISGAGLSGFMGISTIYPIEFLTPKYRQIVCFGPWGFGVMLLSLLGYFVPTWREFLWISSIPFAFILILYPFLLESPRWLIRNSRLTEAQKVLEKIHSINMPGRAESKASITLELLDEISKKETESTSTNNGRVSYLHFFRDRELRGKTFSLICIWFAWGCVYFGISYNIKNIRGNVYWNVVFLGLTDALANPFSLLVNNSLGRRKALISFMGLGTIFLSSLAVLDLIYGITLSSSLVATLCLVGRFGVCGSRTSARLLTSESYPTYIRTMGYGITGLGAGIGGIIAPQLAYFGEQWWNPLPFVTFALIGVGGSALSLLLDETADKTLDNSECTAVEKTLKVEDEESIRQKNIILNNVD